MIVKIYNMEFKIMERNELGQLQQKYTDSSFIAAIVNLHRSSASDIAEAVGCNKRVATIRLSRLVTEGRIKSKKVSGRWVFWV